MEIKELLKNRSYTIDKKNSTQWNELGKELTNYFHANCFWISWRYPMWKIREKFKEIQKLEKKKQTLNYFIGMLKDE